MRTKLLLLLLLPVLSYAQEGEGTRQLRPSYESNGFLYIEPAPGGFTDFAYLNNPDPDDHLNIHIENAGEFIYFGFGRIRLSGSGLSYDTPVPHNVVVNYGTLTLVDIGNTDIQTAQNFIDNRGSDGISDGFYNNSGMRLDDFYYVWYSLKDPAGDPVMEGVVPASGDQPGYIGNESEEAYDRAVAGPAQLVGRDGYWALEHETTQAGDYRLELTAATLQEANTAPAGSVILQEDIATSRGRTYDLVASPGDVNNPGPPNAIFASYDYPPLTVQLFNITVTATEGQYEVTGSRQNTFVNTVDTDGDGDNEGDFFSANNDGRFRNSDISGPNAGASTALNTPEGRVFSRRWGFTVGSFANEFEANLYPYSNDGVVTEINFNGIQPFVFDVSTNSFGTSNTGDPAVDRQSVVGQSTAAEFPVFLQNPDSTAYPSGEVGCIDEIAVNQCVDNAGNLVDCVDITTRGNGTISALFEFVDFSPVNQLDDDPDEISRNISISGSATPQTTCLVFDRRTGTGTEVPEGARTDINIVFQAGLTNLPIFDVEDHRNGYQVSLVRPQQTICGTPLDQFFIRWDDTNLGGDVELSGCTVATGCHTWGDGTSTDNPPVGIGNNNTVNTYWFVTEQVNDLFYNSTNCLLPVELIAFGGEETEEGQHVLHWQTATEQGTDVFFIEHSTDGFNFQELGQEPATNAPQGARYQHTNPYPVAGTNYYRLRIVDKDGSYEYSKVIALLGQTYETVFLGIYPNPVNTRLQVQLASPEAQSFDYQIIDLLGRVQSSGVLSVGAGSQRLELATESLAKGVYVVQMRGADGTKFIQKFIRE